MCWLGMGTKEVMVSAPLTVLLIDRLFIAGSFGAAWRARKGYYAGLAASWVLLGVLVWHTRSRGGTSGFGSGVTAVQYWLTQPGVILRYLQLAVWPHPLVFDYGVEWVAHPENVILPAIVVLGLLAGTVHGLVKNRVWGVLGVFFFAVLAPTSLVPGNRQIAAEQRMYLALIAVVVGAVYGAGWVARRFNADGPSAPGGRAPPTWIPVVLLAGVFGLVTYNRNRDYRSPLVLYGADVAHLPSNAYAQTNYATALLFAKQYPAAKEHFETALRLKPDIQETEDNLGNALFALGAYPEAEAHYRHVIATHPQFADAYNNLAEAYLKEDRVQDARRAVETALKLKTDFGAAHDHLGLVLLREGRLPEAVNELQTATALEPESADHWINYGNALRAARQPSAAADAFGRAAKLDSANAAVYYDWAGAEMDLRQYAVADALLRSSLRIDGSNASAHQNLGNALLAENQAEAAVQEYETAVRLAPNDAVVHYNFGNGLLRLGRRDDAAKELRAALAINPGLQPARALLQALLGAAGRSE